MSLVVTASAIGLALVVLCAYSFLYKENPFYRIMESLYVGCGVGWGLATSLFRFNQTLDPLYKNPGVYWWYIIAIFLGLFWYAYWSKKYFFLYRIPLSYGIGLSIGTSLYGAVYSTFIVQVTATFKGLGATPLDTFNNILGAIGAFTAVLFFYFSKEHKGALGHASRIGRYFILIFLGSAFGNTIMGRTALVITMTTQLLKYPQWLMIPLVIVIFIAVELLKRIGYLREFSPAVAQAFEVRAKGETTD